MPHPIPKKCFPFFFLKSRAFAILKQAKWRSLVQAPRAFWRLRNVRRQIYVRVLLQPKRSPGAHQVADKAIIKRQPRRENQAESDLPSSLHLASFFPELTLSSTSDFFWEKTPFRHSFFPIFPPSKIYVVFAFCFYSRLFFILISTFLFFFSPSASRSAFCAADSTYILLVTQFRAHSFALSIDVYALHLACYVGVCHSFNISSNDIFCGYGLSFRCFSFLCYFITSFKSSANRHILISGIPRPPSMPPLPTPYAALSPMPWLQLIPKPPTPPISLHKCPYLKSEPKKKPKRKNIYGNHQRGFWSARTLTNQKIK